MLKKHHVCPPLWDFSYLEKHFNITVRIGLLRISHIFSSIPLSVVPHVWPVFGFIFSTMDVCRNPLKWWRVRTTSYDVIFTLKASSCQVSIYWIVRWQLFFFVIASPKNAFSDIRLFLIQIGQIFPKSQ